MTENRRVASRQPRHIQVRYRRRGSGASDQVGFTTNISLTGVFLATSRFLPEGTRVVLEIGDQARGFVAEGVVTRVVRVSARLQRVRQGGMGIRFLSIPELVQELAPSIASEGGTRPEADGSFEIALPSQEAFRQVYDRDIRAGGLFVRTQHPARLHELVTVRVRVAGAISPPVEIRARVVQCLAPKGPIGPNLIAGMGLELLDPDETMRRLAALLP